MFEEIQKDYHPYLSDHLSGKTRLWNFFTGVKIHDWFLPSATKLGQGNIFRSVCQEFCPRGGGVSRPRPKGEVGGLAGGWFLGPDPGGEVGRSGQGGCPDPHPGGGGCPGPDPGGCIMHWGRHRPPPSRQLLLRVVRVLLECILVPI